MPTTTPTWFTICWEAPAIPRSRGSTDAVTEADKGGMAMPMPTPARASAPMITITEDDSPSVAIHPMATMTATAPPVAARLAPSRTDTIPAMGPASEKARGRAMLTRPVRVSVKPRMFWSSNGVRMNEPM